tara:strand:+ start:5712 stop:7007 length:1296 start_codon:yes stop_codon:yes gene_type:complete
LSQVSDVSLANQGFSAFRTELNNILGALNSNHIGSSAPSSIAQGVIWVDSSVSGTHTLKYYDGSDSITLCNINTSANTVDFIDSSVSTELVNDTSPQLGGNLDTNSQNILIDDAHFIGDENGNEQIIFQTTASAVNELEVTNAATGNAPSIGASGETNVDLKILPKGTGEIVIGTGSASATLTTNGTHDLVLDTNKGTNSGSITITDGSNGNITIAPNGSGNIVLDALTFPNADGSANQVLKTDGSGALSFTDPGGGAMNLISTTNISDAATVSITGMDSTYKHYKMILTQLHPANDGVDLQGRAIVGGSAHTGSTSYFSIVEHSRTGNASAEFDNQESKSFWNFNHSSENIGNANSDCVNVIIDIFNPSDTTFEKLIRTEINYTHAAVHEQFSRGYGINTLRLTSAFTGIQFFFDSGNIATGTIKLYGLS